MPNQQKSLNQINDLIYLEAYPLSEEALVWNPQAMELGRVPRAYLEPLHEKYSQVQEELLRWSLANEPFEQIEVPKEGIKKLSVNVTQVCNLKCLYCAAGGDGTYGQAQKKIDIQKTLPQLELILSSLSPGEEFRITFLGGEPLLYPEGIELLASYLKGWSQDRGVDIKYSVVTNGTLLNEKNRELLKKYKMDIYLSLDGSPDQVNTMRPGAFLESKTWDKIHQGLVPLMNEKLSYGKITVSGVFNSVNNNLLDAYNFYQRYDFDFYDFNYDLYEESQEFHRSYLDQMLTLSQLAFKKAGFQELKKINNFNIYFQLLDKKQKVSHHCGAGTTYGVLDAKGDFYSCPWLVGKKNYVRDIGQAEPYEARVSPPCHSCWAKNLCGGGCRFHHEISSEKGRDLYCERVKGLIKIAFMYYQGG